MEAQPPKKNIEFREMNDKDLALYASVGQDKPVFEKTTKMIVVNAQLFIRDKTESKTISGDIVEYEPIKLAVTYEHNLKQINEDYGGGRIYTDNATRSFHAGPKSALGKLILQLHDNFEFNGDVKSIPQLLTGKSVGVRSVSFIVGGQTYTKNIIQAFYPS